MGRKQYAEFSPIFSDSNELINSIKNKELLRILENHKIDLSKEIGRITSPINSSGNRLALLKPTPIMPTSKQIAAAKTEYGREGGTMCFYPEVIFADDDGMGFLVRYRIEDSYDFRAFVVRDYENGNYSKLFSNQHNMPPETLKEYADAIDFTDISRLNFYTGRSLTWQALCLCTDNANHKGDIFVWEISQSEMENPAAKRRILESIHHMQVINDYSLSALYSNGGIILHREDSEGNPFDAFMLNVEYYDINMKKILEEHYVFAYAQEMVPFKVDGEIMKDDKGRSYYDIKHIPDARGKNEIMTKEEAVSVFYREMAPSPVYSKFLSL